MMTLLLIDDRELFREGFRLLLATQPDFDVVGEAAALHVHIRGLAKKLDTQAIQLRRIRHRTPESARDARPPPASPSATTSLRGPRSVSMHTRESRAALFHTHSIRHLNDKQLCICR